MGRSKRYRAAREKVGRDKLYTVEEAVATLKTLDGAKFDETVEIAVKLGIDPKKSDQLLRGTFAFPNGIGKEKRVVVFAEGSKADDARKAGAVEVGGADLIKKIEDGWFDFDVAIAAPEMMKAVSRLGKVLGPKGLMPSAKTGTVTENVGQATREFKAGKVEYRTDATGVIHLPVGKKSFTPEALKENILAFVDHLQRAKPASVKGRFLQRVSISTTMGPGVRLKVE